MDKAAGYGYAGSTMHLLIPVLGFQDVFIQASMESKEECQLCVCVFVCVGVCVCVGFVTTLLMEWPLSFPKSIHVFKGLLPCKEASQLILSDLLKLKEAVERLVSPSWILIHILEYSGICASFWSDPDLPCSLPHSLWIQLHITKHKKTSYRTIKIWEKESDKKLHLVTRWIAAVAEWASDEYFSCTGSCWETGSSAVF